MKTIVLTSTLVCWLSGTVAMPAIPIAHAMHERRYQHLRVRVRSPTGAQKNFHIWGKTLAAIGAAPSCTERPAFVAIYASATVTKPPVAPNGRMSKV